MWNHFHQRIDVARRASKRIHLRVKLQVTGRDEHGVPFVSPAETVNVCREGGCLVFNKDVKKEEILRLESPKGIPFVAKVRWSEYNFRRNARYVGFKLVETKKGWVLSDSTR